LETKYSAKTVSVFPNKQSQNFYSLEPGMVEIPALRKAEAGF
jgi:hypothetical protein